MDLKECRAKITSNWLKLEEMKKKNEADNVEPTQEERNTATEILNEIDAFEEMAANLELDERMNSTKERLSKSRRETQRADLREDRNQKGFKRFGDLLQAVVGYYSAGGQTQPDPRLIRSAATGLGETVPSDGGLA